MQQLIETHSPLFICGGTVKDGSASLEVWSTTCNWHWGQEVERGHLHLSPSNHQPSFRTTDSPKTFFGHLPQRQPGWCGRCFVVDPTHAHTHTSTCKGMEQDISSESSLFVSRASGLVFTYWCRSRRKNGRRLFLHVLQSIWKRLCSTEDWHSPSISCFPRPNQPRKREIFWGRNCFAISFYPRGITPRLATLCHKYYTSTSLLPFLVEPQFIIVTLYKRNCPNWSNALWTKQWK